MAFVKLVCICAPAILYFAFCRTRKPDALMAGIAAVVLAIFAGAGYFWMISSPGFWKERAQISWVGVGSSRLGQSLLLGGNRNGTALGWPHPTGSASHFSPQLTVTGSGNE